MKKIIIMSLIMLSVGTCFANELPHSAKSNISFRMPDMSVRLSDEYDDDDDWNAKQNKIKAVSIANRAVGIVECALSVIPYSICIANTILSLWNIMVYNPCLIYGSQMTIAGAMMIYLGVRQAQLVRKGFDKPQYKYEICKVMRNVGIVTLTTSIIPLAGVVPFLIMAPSILGYVVVGVNGVAFLSQLALGIAFLVGGIMGMNRWEEIAFPEVSLVHNDKKGYNEGYSVSLGLRVKI